MVESYGGYVRHRDRMVQESVFQDLQDTLIACRWMAGTTSRPIVDPFGSNTTPVQVTTTLDQVHKLLDGNPINLIDFFPEAEGNDAYNGRTPLNTFAVDTGRPGDATELEMGSKTTIQPYLFNVAFYASSDGAAMAVMNDLRDRYRGSLVEGDYVWLVDFNKDPSPDVVKMEVMSFRYARDAQHIAPNEVHLFFGELHIDDFVDY